ncbi:hypothetical protein [Sulfitobacter sp. JB4-11]|uniref:hypothetical protein n=1 Tax=Sulfitobacter rhodophyticola TaxID=3238304 RepID=UPI003D8150A8
MRDEITVAVEFPDLGHHLQHPELHSSQPGRTGELPSEYLGCAENAPKGNQTAVCTIHLVPDATIWPILSGLL